MNDYSAFKKRFRRIFWGTLNGIVTLAFAGIGLIAAEVTIAIVKWVASLLGAEVPHPLEVVLNWVFGMMAICFSVYSGLHHIQHWTRDLRSMEEDE